MPQTEYQRNYYLRPEVKERRRLREKIRYETDMAYREVIKAKARVAQHRKRDERYRKNPEYRKKKLQYMREYQKQLRELIKTNPNDPRAKHVVEYRKVAQRERERELRKQALKLFGNVCFLCGYSNKWIQFHEIHGKRHRNSQGYALKHKEDFIALCRVCHRAIHRFMQVFKLTWDDILSLKH